MKNIYLDWAASAIPDEEILHLALNESIEKFANPMSLHADGKDAKALLEDARKRIACALGTSANKIVFTSGGSESDSMVLLSVLTRKQKCSIVISAIEHSAIYKQAKILENLGIEVIRVNPNKNGIITPEAVCEAIKSDTVLVAIMAVNNETGAINPIKEIVQKIRGITEGKRQIFIHCDAVQAIGKIEFLPEDLGIDSASFSAHKIGGPRGCGLLYLSKQFIPLVQGGGQENGIRPGTHNTFGAIAFAMAMEKAKNNFDKNKQRAEQLEAILLERLQKVPGLSIIPESRKCRNSLYSPFIVNVAFNGIGGETMQRLLSDNGFDVSSGAACSSAKQEDRVLTSMGIDSKTAFSAIRISTGNNTISDVEQFVETASTLYQKYRTD